MKMSIETRRGLSVICFYLTLLAVLLAVGGHAKMDFHHRAEISTSCLVVAAVLAALGLVLLVSSLGKRTN